MSSMVPITGASNTFQPTRCGSGSRWPMILVPHPACPRSCLESSLARSPVPMMMTRVEVAPDLMERI